MNIAINRSLESKTTSFNEIPIVDIGPLLDNSEPIKVADKIGYVCENIGFLYIKNHGISKELINEAYTLAEAFFSLPVEEKNKLDIKLSGPTLRGYIPMYRENVDPGFTRDFKECFDFGLHQDEVSPFHGPNLMPETPLRFKEVFEQYHAAMLNLSRKLIGAIALSLDLPQDYFEDLQKNPITIQRLLHYPPQEGEIALDEMGIGAHTDYGFLTILSQDSSGGLQVQNRQGDWIEAPPVEDTFIVNIGDLVQTFTNDRYISTVHRVINKSGRERYSIPFFIDLDYEAVVQVVPTCSRAGAAEKYAPYTSGEHKYKRFVDSYIHLQNQ
ncbi:isopenicillin N synthase family oxygenase [Motiliproteus sp. MSK22-1]|uniref:isopenicillin N synthase family dioxygenase n=1 Tax=Motiliproteus sp. MSK22-1 TaxID=1897630 RepID=UPI001E61290F|nr:2-oxoglutarate and iron-dependent oxygenase domain-containing protein [Motiliproteus sp. MSK22-1]